MSVDEVLWELEPHTKAKHEILKSYLGAWFPILSSGHQRVVYVDGFAGPGVYKGGEDGSPIIALKVAQTHRLLSNSKEIVFLFIEADERRVNQLKQQIKSIILPSNFKVGVECDSFENSISKVLDSIIEQGKHLAPSFFFIDPFGPTGFSMELIKKICTQNRSEVLINFSYQSLNQWFLHDPSKYKSLDLLFGDNKWQKALSIENPKEKEEYLRLAYQNSLEKLGWRVKPFSMINKHNQTQYYLFFATKSPLGMLVMKNAMWKSAPTGDFRYSDLSNPAQLNMFEETDEIQHFKDLADIIYSKHKGQSVSKNILVEEVSWHPLYIGRHLTGALKYLENKVKPSRILSDLGRKKKGFYPDGCTIVFL
jgi:three-Cys-motif partner protein